MKQICKLCDYEWESKTDHPKQCPRCKRYDYTKELSPEEEVIKEVVDFGDDIEKEVEGGKE